MKTFWTLILCACCTITYAQVGVGTIDPQAALEVSGDTNGGFLAPRYALSGDNDATTVVNPSGMPLVNGTLVINTTAVTGANALEAGLVSWNGSTWDELTSSTNDAVYGQIFKTSNTNGTDLTAAVIFGTNSVSNGITLNGTNVETGTVTGLYRVTFTINLQRIANNNNIEFFLTQGAGAANKVAGSSAFASVRGGAVRSSLTKTILIDVTAANQQFFVYPATTDADIRILPDSSLLVELVKAD